MALALGVSQFLCYILLVIGSVSLFLDNCASLAPSSRKRNAPSMTCSLKVSSSDSPSLMFGGVLSRLSNCSNPIVVGATANLSHFPYHKKCILISFCIFKYCFYYFFTLYCFAIFFSLDAGFFQYHQGVKQFGS